MGASYVSSHAARANRTVSGTAASRTRPPQRVLQMKSQDRPSATSSNAWPLAPEILLIPQILIGGKKCVELFLGQREKAAVLGAGPAHVLGGAQGVTAQPL